LRKGLALAGAALLALALLLLLLAAQRGEVTLALFLVFPVLTITGAVGAVGALLLLPALALLFLSLVPAPAERDGADGDESDSGAPAKRGVGGVVLIGPVPILFGSAKGLRGSWLLGIMVAAATLLAVVTLILLW
jgi:uncharacterized protein (TIGR00304 family)